MNNKKLSLQSLLFIPLTIASLCLGPSLASAVEVEGFSLPDTQTIGTKTLKITGRPAVRKATIFAVKVYAGALYLETPLAAMDSSKKISDDELKTRGRDLVSSPQIKRVQMTFVRDVSGKDIQKTWRENFEKNCGSDCEKYKSKLEELVEFLKDDVKKGDTFVFSFLGDQNEVKIRAQSSEPLSKTVGDATFGRILLSAWVVNVSATEVRDAFLGKP